MTAKQINWLLLGLGLAGLLWMLHAVGVAKVASQLITLGWGLIPLILLEGLGEVLHAAAWRSCLAAVIRPPPWPRLFGARLAGFAINYLTPTAGLGGEVTRTALVAPDGQMVKTAGGVLIDKAVMALAHVLVALLAGTLFMGRVRLPPTLRMAMLVSLSLVFAGIVAFVLLQKNGRFAAIMRRLAARHGSATPLRRLAQNAAALDETFRAFYRDHRRNMAIAIVWHIAGFGAGWVQALGFFLLLRQPVPIAVVTEVWAIGLWFDLLVFAVPMNLGMLEGSRAIIFAALGYPTVAGVSFGMVIRLGQLFWAMVGLAVYVPLTSSPP